MNLAMVRERIVEVAPAGELHHVPGSRALVIDLAGKVVTPGLWDSHMHLYHWSQMRHQLQLASCTNVPDLLAAVAGAPAGESWLIGHGWSLHGFSPEPPNRHQLDAVTGERPALLWCGDLHSALANTAALARAGLLDGQRQVEGGVIERDDRGSPTGWLRELAANLVREAVPPPSDAALSDQLLQAAQELHRLGITGICDQRVKDQNEGQGLFRVLRRLELDGRWNLRTSLNLAAHHLEYAVGLGLTTGFGTDRLRLGHMKVFADGSLGSATARMLEPFLHSGTGPDGRGIYLTQPHEMRPLFQAAARAGISVSVHAIGDEANRVCLDLFEELDHLGIPRPRVPHRVEHAQMLDDADLGRFAALGLTVSVQAGHLLDDRAAADSLLGARSRLCYRFGDLRRHGAKLVFGTDAPVSEIDPRFGIRAALRRCAVGDKPWYPEQALPSEVVWEGYTWGAAQACGWNDVIGPLAPGYRADLAVWNGDPNQDGAQVTHTFFDGKLVYAAP
jgi:predicted amidohydrolase YtcJ